MNFKDALSILNIQANHVTPEDIKLVYRKAAAKYHPDHNPAGLEMMKMVNVAYDTLKDYEGIVEPSVGDYGDAINTALNAIINLELKIEICGSWVWVSGDTKPHREILKVAGYLWSPKKLSWYFRSSDYKSYNRSSWDMEKIRAVYGSQHINQGEATKRLCG